MTLNAHQILAHAPDAASAKVNSQLTAPHHWSNLGPSQIALWGECQGSGKNPYRTQIDLNGPAFKCSCPSRKFPCKHGLGLYLLRAADSARAEMMTALRDAAGPLADALEARREAHMRSAIRQAVKEGRERIAIVCGAWHVPVLAKMPTAKSDADLLRGWRKKRWRRPGRRGATDA